MKTILKLLLFILIGGMLAKGGTILFEHRELTHKENRGVMAFNKENYEKAIAIFKETLQDLPDHEVSRKSRVERYLARSHKNKADDCSLPLSESIELYRKASNYDEDLIEDEKIKELLKAKFGSE